MKKYRLTTQQANIWNLQKYYEGTSISNLCGAIIYDESRDLNALQQAINAVIADNESLRLRFSEDGEVVQYLADCDAPIEIRSFETETDLDMYAETVAKTPMLITDSQMCFFTVFSLGTRSGIVAKLSHLIADAWSFGLIADRIEVAYQKRNENKRLYSYLQYINKDEEYRNSDRYIKDRRFWEEKYQSCPERSVLKQADNPASSNSDSIAADRIVGCLSEGMSKSISTYCDINGVSETVLFESAVLLYLLRINQNNKTVTIGFPVLNRGHLSEKNTTGMFISTIPLTVTADTEDSVTIFLNKVAAAQRGIFRHQRYPYEEILKDLRKNHSFAGTLYDVMVSVQNAKIHGQIPFQTRWYSNGYSEVPLVVSVDRRDGQTSYTVTLDYQTHLFTSRIEAELFYKRLLCVLEEIITAGQDTPVHSVNLLSEKEEKLLLEQFNNTYVDYSGEKCIHRLFTEQAGKTPDRIALIFGDKRFTYRELDGMSDSLAWYLKKEGLRRSEIVPIISRRDWRIIVAMLGILKAGGAYMPVSPEYPEDRIRTMMEIAGCRKALCYGYEGELPCKKTDLAEFDFDKDQMSVENINEPDDLCYIIFTSGSTGTPKGCCIRHRNFANTLLWRKEEYNKDNKDIICTSSIFTDTFGEDIFSNLISNSTIHLVRDNKNLNAIKDEYKSSVTGKNCLMTTPTFFSAIMNTMKNVKWSDVTLVGEQLTKDVVDKYAAYFEMLHNEYGPSECSVCASYKKISINDSIITIGRPIANTQIYILDDRQNLLPIGVAGELCIAGAGVGTGYLNQQQLTAEKFIPNPYATEEKGHGKVLYRTGDLARWNMDGQIEYLGRIDTQVKIRGLRIELGEIESVMAETEGIGLVAAAAQKDEAGRQYLVGYYTSDAEIDETALRNRLTKKLPKYMVPNYFMRLDAMPMTASGKTDRKSLPVPVMSVETREYVAPDTETEKTLSRLWAKTLKIEKLGKDDDFFELGGDSLSAIALVSQIEEIFGAGINIQDLYKHPKLSEMAQLINSAEKTERLVPASSDCYELLPQQKAVYAACRKAPDSLTYNAPGKLKLNSKIDRERLKKAIQDVISGHKGLNCRIIERSGQPCAVYDPDAQVVVEELLSEKEFLRPYQFDTAPLVHVALAGDDLLFDVHHIVSDGTSLRIILDEVAEAYEGSDKFSSEKEDTLWYGDYAEYIRDKNFSRQLEYFKNRLVYDLEPISLPEEKTNNSGGRSASYTIETGICTAARRFARRHGITDTMLFFGAYGILLSRFSGRKELLTSIILQNRMMADTKEMVGMFVNTLPVCIKADGGAADYYQCIKKDLTELYQYQDVPLLTIAEALNMAADTINTSFVYQPDGSRSLQLGGLTLVPEQIETGTAKFDLLMEILPAGDGVTIRLEYNCEKYSDELSNRLAETYKSILKQLGEEGADAIGSVRSINVLPEQEKELLLKAFNNSHVEYPADKCVHQLFTEQVMRTPDETALIFRNRRFTYKELDRMSDSLACQLREKGLRRNDIVPIIARRDWRIIVAMMGILKAGGAYMPVSPDYPEERIRTMLSVAECGIVLCYGYDGSLPVEKIDLAAFDFDKDQEPVANKNRPDDLCYIIFTSGSTGTPKGVSVMHRNVSNYAHNNTENKVVHSIGREDYQTIVSVTNIVFDIFVTESLLPLLNGKTICLADDEEAMFQMKLAGLIEQNGVDVIQTTPTRMRTYLMDKTNLSYLRKLKAVVLGGEAFPSDLYTELRSATDAHVYNIYGPAETTVWSTNTEVTGASGITIGRPIANTQIYILDDQQNLLPIGVAGELCIAGDGVGKGYLNRPDLTAERFIPNPYATEENGHGKVLYRTGDLARWRMDGQIEYLGRIDTQVKIRGLRIELGEIESVMAETEGIGLIAVAAKKDETGRQYLAGYYTSDTKIDEKELRSRLTKKLPKYMVPNYFMKLDAMPMTASGKTDRKNLPVPDMSGETRDYVAPVTEMETKLCRLMEDVLSIDRIGTQDDFFELGGDSLKAITFVAMAHEAGMEISLQGVYDHTSVREICEYLNAKASGEIAAHSTGGSELRAEDLKVYNSLLRRNTVDESQVLEKKALGNVLLTGATGFLGAHILDALMRMESGKIYCLVRGKNKEDISERLKNTLLWYFGHRYQDEIGRRIIPVKGDVEQPGLSDNMPDDIQTVMHSAANVKHYGPYKDFYRSNVQGTRNAASFAREAGAELIHISTISISGNAMADGDSVYRSEEELHFTETDLFVGQPLDNVYIRSKFEAERMVLDEMIDKGLKAKIIRIGNLTNRTGDFKFQQNYTSNAFLKRMKAILELGLFPDYLMPLYSEFSPVDLTAEGIIRIAQYADRQIVFHLYSNKPLMHVKMLPMLEKAGISLKVVTGEAFYKAVEETLRTAGREYIYESLQNDMDDEGYLLYDSNIHIDNGFTIAFLKKTGFEWNEIDEEYIKGYIAYFREAGYLNV